MLFQDGEGEDILATGGGIGEEDEEEEEEEEEEEDEDDMGRVQLPTSGTSSDKRNVDMDLEDLEMLIDTRYLQTESFINHKNSFEYTNLFL